MNSTLLTFFTAFFALVLTASSTESKLSLAYENVKSTHKALLDVIHNQINTLASNQDVSNILYINLAAAIIRNVKERHDELSVERINMLLNVALMVYTGVSPALKAESKSLFKYNSKCLKRGELWAQEVKKIAAIAFPAGSPYRQAYESLLAIKELIGEARGWDSVRPSNDDTHDFMITVHVSASLLVSLLDKPELFSLCAKIQLNSFMLALMRREKTFHAKFVAGALGYLSQNGMTQVNTALIHPEILALMREESEKAAEDIIKVEVSRAERRRKGRDEKKVKRAPKKEETAPNDKLQKGLMGVLQSSLIVDENDVHIQDELDSDSEDGQMTFQEAKQEVEIDESWRPSPIWKLYAKVVKAQHCRISKLIPLRDRIQQAMPDCKKISWADLPHAPGYEEHLGDFHDEEVKTCIQMVTERNQMVHNGSLLKYLHDADEVVAHTGFPAYLIKELLALNPAATMASPKATIDFSSRHLSERNCRRAIFILALFFIIDEIVPANRKARYAPITAARKEVAHPAIVQTDIAVIQEFMV